MFDFAITTDYVKSRGSPWPYLRQIAQAGWKWVHWCHHWNDDHVYDAAELLELKTWLDQLGLRVLDIHGSTGKRHRWDSPRESDRLQGVELVRNRIAMAQQLGCDVVIMHPSNNPTFFQARHALWDALC